MTRTQAPPPSGRPSGGGGGMEVKAITVSVAEAVTKLDEENLEVRAMNLRGISGQPWYQIYTKTSPVPHYISAVDGDVPHRLFGNSLILWYQSEKTVKHRVSG